MVEGNLFAPDPVGGSGDGLTEGERSVRRDASSSWLEEEIPRHGWETLRHADGPQAQDAPSSGAPRQHFANLSRG